MKINDEINLLESRLAALENKDRWTPEDSRTAADLQRRIDALRKQTKETQ